MAYITCPWCLTPQLIGDDAPGYQCFTCAGEIRFYECPECKLVQTVSKKWRSFRCGKCDTKLDLPHQFGYFNAAKAFRVRGTGKSWPPL